MRSIAITLAAGGLALAASAGAASASERVVLQRAHYVTTYVPQTRYVRRTVVVRERVWRPVRHRVHYRRVYVAPAYDYVSYGYAPAYGYGYDNGWEWRRREHWRREHWRREHWRQEHRGWDHDRWGYGGW